MPKVHTKTKKKDTGEDQIPLTEEVTDRSRLPPLPDRLDRSRGWGLSGWLPIVLVLILALQTVDLLTPDPLISLQNSSSVTNTAKTPTMMAEGIATLTQTATLEPTAVPVDYSASISVVSQVQNHAGLIGGYDADLTIALTANGVPWGDGKVTVESDPKIPGLEIIEEVPIEGMIQRHFKVPLDAGENLTLIIKVMDRNGQEATIVPEPLPIMLPIQRETIAPVNIRDVTNKERVLFVLPAEFKVLELAPYSTEFILIMVEGFVRKELCPEYCEKVRVDNQLALYLVTDDGKRSTEGPLFPAPTSTPESASTSERAEETILPVERLGDEGDFIKIRFVGLISPNYIK